MLQVLRAAAAQQRTRPQCSSAMHRRSLHIRVGVLVPSTNSSFEGDWQAVAAQLNLAASVERQSETNDFRLTVHGARLYLENDSMFTDPENSMLRMNDQIAEQSRALATANVDLVAYGCTTGSFFKGPGWDEEMEQVISENAVGNRLPIDAFHMYVQCIISKH
jgi:maleate cis-trans isomerase